MKKFNPHEAYWIKEGLELAKKKAIAEIVKIEKSGRIPLMTKGYVTDQIEEIKVKVTENTRK